MPQHTSWQHAPLPGDTLDPEAFQLIIYRKYWKKRYYNRFIFKSFFKMYLVLTVLCLLCLCWGFLSCSDEGHTSLVRASYCGASLVAGTALEVHGLRSCGHGLSCSATWDLPGPEWNPCLLFSELDS